MREPWSEDDARRELRGWVSSVAGEECAALASTLPLDDDAARLRVLAALVDCVLRRVVPLATLERYPNLLPLVRTLPPVTDSAGRERARSILRSLNTSGPSAVGSAALALMHLAHFAEAESPEDAATAWRSIFYSSGCLYMAVYRSRRAGAEDKQISAAFLETLGALRAE